MTKFFVTDRVNKRNDCCPCPVPCVNPSLRRVTKRRKPSSVMVIVTMTSNREVMDPIFVDL